MYPRFFKDCCASLFLLLIFALYSTAAAQNNSPLAEGQWYKIGITKEGIYKLSFQYLQNHGVVGSTTNPQNIRIFGQGGGMLPQANDQPRSDGLQENAVFVSGEQDGQFNPQDYILFYGQGPDKIRFNPENNQFDYEKNVYSDTVFYFITVGSEKGKRVSSSANLAVSNPVIREYDGFFAFEEDNINLLNSGRRWFGQDFTGNFSQTYPPAAGTSTPVHQYPLYNILPNSTLTVSSAFVGTDSVPSVFTVSVNNFVAQTVQLPASNFSQRNLYAEKGRIKEQTDQVNTGNLGSLDKLSVRIDYQGRSSTSNAAYLDYITVSAKCMLEYRPETGIPLFFRSSESLQHDKARFEIGGATTGILVWDLTNPQQPRIQEAGISGNILSFGTTTGALKEFVAFRPEDVTEPQSIRKIANQNLRSDTSPEFVIIAPPALAPEANRLAAFRQQTQGLKIKVVSPEQIYNEFSSGAQDITAIRDYMRFLYEGSGRLRYLLLFGRGSYDYKKRNNPDYNLVPVYESYNSTHPIFSYTSDDYYGFLEKDEGSWEEINDVSHSLEIGIGRLPAKNAKEAKQMVDKLIRYEDLSATSGSWRNSILFIADDEDGNVHHRDAEKLSEITEKNWPAANINKIYLGAYPQVALASGESSPAAVKAINNAIDKGALFVNYTGHGRYDILTEENIITKPIIDTWTNKNKLSLFVTATCEFGQHDNKLTSGAEHLLLHPEGGAIGLVTASRPVYSHTNFEINSAFYEYALPSGSNINNSLGDIIRLTKNKGVESTGVVNRNFLLLGDPSMKMAYPVNEIHLQELQYESSGEKADTLGAFETVKAIGSVMSPAGQADPSFNGIMEAVVYEKPHPYETIDPKAPKMLFNIRNKVIFRGKVKVEQGDFAFSFVVPKSIAYNYGSGKVSLYATDTTRQLDAVGYYSDFMIGGSSKSAGGDSHPPRVKLYLNDTTFVNGEKVGQKSTLIAYLRDENGINIMSNGVDGGIVATLDGKTTFELNDYYFSDMGSYTSGSLKYPLEVLLPGPHTLTLTARDSYNNISKSTIEFIVSGKNDFQVYKAYNSPNPFRDYTRIEAEHSRAGEDIEADLFIYNLAGQLVSKQNQIFPQSLRKLEFEEWDGSRNGRKLTPGIYLFKVVLRSLTDGSRAERTEKLVILN